MNAVASRHLLGALSLVLCCGCSMPPNEPGDWAGPKGTWQPVFTDDFDGPAGSAPNPASWNVVVDGTPYNGELEYYTNRSNNVMLDGAGHLVLTAQREAFVDASGQASVLPYTSGRIDTHGHVAAQYGRVETRAKLVGGKGLWPAFWMLGEDIDTVGWPSCGEVDIFELGGSNPALITGSLHAPGYYGGNALHGHFVKEVGSFADDYHVYAFEWAADGARWLIDELPYTSRTPAGLAEQGLAWAFDKPMYVVVNLAVGGIYDGNPDSNTPMPSSVSVDWVRVSKLIPQGAQ